MRAVPPGLPIVRGHFVSVLGWSSLLVVAKRGGGEASQVGAGADPFRGAVRAVSLPTSRICAQRDGPVPQGASWPKSLA